MAETFTIPISDIHVLKEIFDYFPKLKPKDENTLGVHIKSTDDILDFLSVVGSNIILDNGCMLEEWLLVNKYNEASYIIEIHRAAVRREYKS